MTTVCATAGAVGGASAGELFGGDLAISAIGPIAQPLGEAAGRNIGRLIGGALGASVICATRSASRGRRSSSAVRFI